MSQKIDQDSNLVQQAEQLNIQFDTVRKEISKVIIGQEQVVELLLITLLARGHALFVGVPGLGKTLLVQTLANVLELGFSRIQFTPDLMPSDITGSEILEIDHETNKRYFQFKKGPIFCNLLLADEINRTPPKTQSALLQAMQEYSVTSGGISHKLPSPFHVFATQNPIEQEGTYPLPEAQLDRFMMMIEVAYPSFTQEYQIVKETTGVENAKTQVVIEHDQIAHFQSLIASVPISDDVLKHTVTLTRSTRPGDEGCPEAVKKYIKYGVGPRAIQHLVLAAKSRAVLSGRFAVDVKDITSLFKPIMRHRLIRSYQAEAENVIVDDILQQLLEHHVW